MATLKGGLAHDVSILLGVGRHLGSQPGAKVSITIMRPPQRGQGQDSIGGVSVAISGCSCGSAAGGAMLRNARAVAMVRTRLTSSGLSTGGGLLDVPNLGRQIVATERAAEQEPHPGHDPIAVADARPALDQVQLKSAHLEPASASLSAGIQSLGSCPRAAGWSAATLSRGTLRNCSAAQNSVAIGA
jgi:hypothetical protein